LLEAMQRGLWQAPGDYQNKLEDLLLDSDSRWKEQSDDHPLAARPCR
jgi:hypothetical protein